MFVQMIEGAVADAERARAEMEAWERDLAPGADGWLGATAGVTADDTLVVIARFDSEEAARANSDRPEQGEWWSRMEQCFDGSPEFSDSAKVFVDTPGDPSRAGFVQIIKGKADDPDRAFELLQGDASSLPEHRPDILGRLVAGHDSGGWTMVVYFTSLEDARAGEQQEPPPALEKEMEELRSLSRGEFAFLDLAEPWLSPSH